MKFMPKKISNYTIQITLLPIVLLSCSSLLLPRHTTETHFNDTHIEEILLDYAFSPDGATLGIYTNGGVYLYDLVTMQETAFIKFDNKDNQYSLIKGGAIAFSHNGMQMAVSGRFKGDPIKIFDTDTYEHISTISLNLPEYEVTELEFSPTGESIVIRNTWESMCHGPEDKLALYSFATQEIVFEVDKCAIYPPIRFHFTKDEKLFLYLQSMSPEYSAYFIDSITGVIIDNHCNWGEKDGFFGSSPDANIQLLRECFSAETLDKIHSNGNILLFPNINRYVLNNYSSETIDGEFPIEFWENGERVCKFETTRGSPLIKASANEQILAFGDSILIEQNTYDYQLFVWDVDSCEKIGVWQFDSH